MTGLIIIGGGGHARVLVDALLARRRDILGFVSNELQAASGVMTGIPRIGGDDDPLSYRTEDILLVNGVGSVGNQERRRKVFEMYRAKGFSFASVVHPSTTIASD